MSKVALVLGGGGAKGAFQVAAEKYAREVKGYNWSVISGVSVGALNGTILLSVMRCIPLLVVDPPRSVNRVHRFLI